MSLKKTERELLEICLENSGEHVAFGHPSTSFATTYSYQFVKASAELYQRYHAQDPGNATRKLYIAMREAKIPSCRGGLMTFHKVDYLVKQRISSFLYRQATEK